MLGITQIYLWHMLEIHEANRLSAVLNCLSQTLKIRPEENATDSPKWRRPFKQLLFEYEAGIRGGTTNKVQ